MNLTRTNLWKVKQENEHIDKILAGKTDLRVGFWDLECTSLSAMIGRVLCCSFKSIGQKAYTFRGDDAKYKGRRPSDDSKLVVAIRDELEKFDIIVGHNSKMFDARFLAGRLLKAGARAREKRLHVDTMWVIRSHMRVSSKLDNVQQFLGLPLAKTPISWESWQDAAANLKEAMDEVVHHCEQDVKVLELAYYKLIPYVGSVILG